MASLYRRISLVCVCSYIGNSILFVEKLSGICSLRCRHNHAFDALYDAHFADYAFGIL